MCRAVACSLVALPSLCHANVLRTIERRILVSRVETPTQIVEIL